MNSYCRHALHQIQQYVEWIIILQMVQTKRKWLHFNQRFMDFKSRN